jgi:hypothetical protein
MSNIEQGTIMLIGSVAADLILGDLPTMASSTSTSAAATTTSSDAAAATADGTDAANER